MENIYLFFMVVFMIVGLVIYHAIFEIWYFNLGRGLLRELVGAAIFGIIMTTLTIKFWWISMIIIVIIGLGVSAKIDNPTWKKGIIIAFIIVAIITAITGSRFNEQQREKETAKYEDSVDYMDKCVINAAVYDSNADIQM